MQRAAETTTASEKRALKSPAEASWVTIVLFFLCLALLATSVYFFARGTIGSSNVTIETAPTAESAAIQAQVEQLVRSQDQLVNTVVAMLGIGATMVTVVLALASYLFDRRNRNVIDELNSALEGERLSREANSAASRQRFDTLTHRLDQLEARFSYSPPGSSGPNPIVMQEFKDLRERIERRIAADPDLKADVYALLDAAREINRMETGQGVSRSDVADLLRIVEDAGESGRWNAVLSEFYEFSRAVMNFVGNVERWEYMAGVSLGPAAEPAPPAEG